MKLKPLASPQARWSIITLVRIVAAVATVAGVVLLARAQDTGSRVLAVAWVLSALYVMATVPLALAHRWRSGDAPTPRSWKRRR